MLNRNISLEVSKKGINIEGKSKSKYKDIKSIRVKHKKIYIKVKEEEIHIRLLKIPRVNKYNIEKVIQNQLIFTYGKDAEDIVYTYDIWNEEKNEIEVIIYCVKSYRLNSIKSIVEKNKLKSIEFVQISMLNNLKDKINNKEYVLIMKQENYIYFLGVGDEKLISNRIVECNCNNENLIEVFKYTISKMGTFNIVPKVVYEIDFEEDSLIKYLEKNRYKYISLKNKDKSNVVDYFRSK